ncbi:hypothetical protein [Pseudorhodoplanes sp.]|uniref:hypothetical protein n=1 Tax=Pseudorhodoplanes sp. TaxID=1934341 RepID=UPI002C8D3E84|nr:hypothetical protein [Pseudorhodoplanes sp.]HWV44109.1 hypothetical protein [Pseudorhodoplanes sp.]
MFKLLWAIAVMTAQGPMQGTIPESTTFKDRAACEAFGAEMTPRLQDWARGRLNADWNIEVRSAFRCEPAGDPA